MNYLPRVIIETLTDGRRNSPEREKTMLARTVSIKGVGKPAHRMFFGTAIPAMLAGDDANGLLSAAVDAGFNAIDTARSYGRAEESIARWLKSAPGNRDRIVLLTKCCDIFGDTKRKVVTAERIRREMDESLKTLGTDHVDILLLHRDDPTHPVAEFIETLEALRREGKCLAYGGSNWRHERIAEANAYAAAHGCQGMTISSPHYGLAEQVQDPYGGDCVTVTGSAEAAARAWYRETRMPLLAYSSLGRGFFSGRFASSDVEGAKKSLDEFARRGYLCDANLRRLARAEEIAAAHGVAVATVAMAYLLTDPMNTLAVVGMSSAKRIQENLKAFDFEFAPGERESLAVFTGHCAGDTSRG